MNSGNDSKVKQRTVIISVLALLVMLLFKKVAPTFLGQGLYLGILTLQIFLILLQLALLIGSGFVADTSKKVFALLRRINFQLNLLTATLFSIEFLFQLLLLLSKPAQSYDGQFSTPSDIVGWMPWANHSAASVMVAKGDSIYNVEYSFDSVGRRIYPQPGDSNYQTHAIFIGCSMTLGEGINTDGTYAALLTNLDTTIHSYNYGMRGWGPHQTLHLFGQLNAINNDVIKEDSGVCIYTYIDPHLWRVYGGLRYLQWGSSSPEVRIDKNGDLHSGARRSPEYKLLKMLSSSAALRYFNIDYPNSFSISFYQRFAAIVNYNARQYYRLFPKGKFYVALYPGVSEKTDWLKYIDSSRIKVLHFSELEPLLKDATNTKYRLRLDGHPTKKANELFVKLLHKKL